MSVLLENTKKFTKISKQLKKIKKSLGNQIVTYIWVTTWLYINLQVNGN